MRKLVSLLFVLAFVTSSGCVRRGLSSGDCLVPAFDKTCESASILVDTSLALAKDGRINAATQTLARARQSLSHSAAVTYCLESMLLMADRNWKFARGAAEEAMLAAPGMVEPLALRFVALRKDGEIEIRDEKSWEWVEEHRDILGERGAHFAALALGYTNIPLPQALSKEDRAFSKFLQSLADGP